MQAYATNSEKETGKLTIMTLNFLVINYISEEKRKYPLFLIPVTEPWQNKYRVCVTELCFWGLLL